MIVESPLDLVFRDLFFRLRAFAGHHDVFLKLEGFHVTGSIKIKTAIGLIEDLERRGLRPLISISWTSGRRISEGCRLSSHRLSPSTRRCAGRGVNQRQGLPVKPLTCPGRRLPRSREDLRVENDAIDTVLTAMDAASIGPTGFFRSYAHKDRYGTYLSFANRKRSAARYHFQRVRHLLQIERDAGHREAAITAATEAYGKAWCDGEPFAYAPGLRTARAHLAALGAPEPHLPPFDPPQHEPMPEVEIDPPDEQQSDEAE